MCKSLLAVATLALLGILHSPRGTVTVMGMDLEQSARGGGMISETNSCTAGDEQANSECDKKCERFNTGLEGCCVTSANNSEHSRPYSAAIMGISCGPYSDEEACHPEGNFCNCCSGGYSCGESGCYVSSLRGRGNTVLDCDETHSLGENNGNDCIDGKCECNEATCESSGSKCRKCGENGGLCQDKYGDDCGASERTPKDLIIE